MLRAVQKELETVDDPGDNHRDAALASVELNEEGFFLYPAQCTEAMVLTLAARVGISELSDRHWQVIRFTRNHFLEPGMGPTVRHLGKAWGSRSGSYTGTPASMS